MFWAVHHLIAPHNSICSTNNSSWPVFVSRELTNSYSPKVKLGDRELGPLPVPQLVCRERLRWISARGAMLRELLGVGLLIAACLVAGYMMRLPPPNDDEPWYLWWDTYNLPGGYGLGRQSFLHLLHSLVP